MYELLNNLLLKEKDRKQLAAKLGITTSYISHLSIGDRRLSKKLAKKIKVLYPDLVPLVTAIQLKDILE